MSLKDKVKLINLIQATWSEIYALEVQQPALEIEMIVAKAKLAALNVEWRKRFPGEKVPVFGSPNPFEVQRLQDQVKALGAASTAGAFTPRRDTYISPFKASAADPAAAAPPPAPPARAVSTSVLTTAASTEYYGNPFKSQKRTSAFDPAPAADPAAAPPAAPRRRRPRRMITDPNNPFRQIPDPNDTDEEEEEYH